MPGIGDTGACGGAAFRSAFVNVTLVILTLPLFVRMAWATQPTLVTAEIVSVTVRPVTTGTLGAATTKNA